MKTSETTLDPEKIDDTTLNPESGETPTPEPKKTSTSKRKAKKENETETGDDKVKDIPEKIDSILKIFPQYSELYIDSHGGVFTPGTPENIRKNAILYTNKYHNK